VADVREKEEKLGKVQRSGLAYCDVQIAVCDMRHNKEMKAIRRGVFKWTCPPAEADSCARKA
jgi:hypothetical protein